MKLTDINEQIAQDILEMISPIMVGSAFNTFFYLGIRKSEERCIDVEQFGVKPVVSMGQDVSSYLWNIETKRIEGYDKFIPGTPHFIAGVQICELITACYTPAGEPYSSAIAAAYGILHHRSEIGSTHKPLSVSKLLSFAKNWQEKNLPDNKILLPLLESILDEEPLS